MQYVVIKFSDVIDRLKQATGAEKDADLARLLGEPPKKIGVWRSRDTVPYELLVSFCSQHGLRLEWVLTGQGNAREERRAIVAEPEAAFSSAMEKATSDIWYRPDYQGQIEQQKPTLDQATHLLRMIIAEYDDMRPESQTKARDTAMIFRHFIDNFHRSNDEVEIREYIEEWF